MASDETTMRSSYFSLSLERNYHYVLAQVWNEARLGDPRQLGKHGSLDCDANCEAKPGPDRSMGWMQHAVGMFWWC